MAIYVIFVRAVQMIVTKEFAYLCRAVARSENLGWHVLLCGDNVPPLVELGFTDLPKSGVARAPPAPPLATGLQLIIMWSDKWLDGKRFNTCNTKGSCKAYKSCSIIIISIQKSRLINVCYKIFFFDSLEIQILWKENLNGVIKRKLYDSSVLFL